MRREEEGLIKNLDIWLLVSYLFLVIAGWFNIYAAVYNEEAKSIFDVSQNYGKQMIWIVLSLVIAGIILLFDTSFFTVFAYPIYGILMVVLVAVIFLGSEIKGSHAWIKFGGFQIQPAEFAKFATCLALSKYLSSLNIDMRRISTRLMAGLIIFLPAIIIILQNETGTALVYGAFIFVLYREGLSGNFLLFGLLVVVLFLLALLVENQILFYLLSAVALIAGFINRKKRWVLLVIVLLFAFCVGFVYSVDYMFQNKLQAHQKKRIEVLLGIEKDLKGAGYNVNQSKIAIGSGGFAGKGFLQGTQTKYNFVPEQSTDFIFCTIGEEWGFLGSLVVIGAFVFFMIRIIYVAERQRSQFSRIYGYGLASIIFFHFSINIGMTIGLAPVIGIPLPFFSYGGSSLWSFTILLFIFLKLDSNRLLVLR